MEGGNLINLFTRHFLWQ